MVIRKYIRKIISETVFLNEDISLIRGVGKNLSGNVDLFGRGLYLTNDIDVAKFYGDKIEQYNIEGKIFDTSKSFNSGELTLFSKTLDEVLNTNAGSNILKGVIDYNEGELPEDTNVDYIRISWSLNSDAEFRQVLKSNNLIQNEFNSYANDCTAMNLVLQKMGYSGLKYSTSEIEDLEDNGLGNKDAYLIFDKNSVS